MQVASPVEDFFLMIDGLPAASKVEAEKLTGGISSGPLLLVSHQSSGHGMPERFTAACRARTTQGFQGLFLPAARLDVRISLQSQLKKGQESA